MATKTPTQLTLANALDIDDTVIFVIDDNDANTRKMTLAQLRTQIFSIITNVLTLTGDVTGTGANNGSVATTVANGAVTLAKMASVATNVLLGRSTAGTGVVETIAIGDGLTLSAGTLTASIPAGAAPSATILTHRAFGGL
jgi:hypothetical protein